MDEDGASVGAPTCDEDEEEKKKRSVLTGAEASYLLERNIFLPCFVRCDRPRSPRDSSMDRQFRSISLSLSSPRISCYDRHISIFNYSDSLQRGGRMCVHTLDV